MEFTIFRKPEVSKHLKRFIEARLHMDRPDLKDRARIIDFQKRITGSTGMPIYVIVEPDRPEAKIEQFDNYDATGGVEFAKFLDRNAK